MGLDQEMYEKVRNKVTGGRITPAMDAYAKAYFSVPPITGEWTEEAMDNELYMLLWNHYNGCIDIRCRSAERILEKRLLSTKNRLEGVEESLGRISEEYRKMAAFITRFHLEELYEDHLEDLRTGAYSLWPSDNELPFE